MQEGSVDRRHGKERDKSCRNPLDIPETLHLSCPTLNRKYLNLKMHKTPGVLVKCWFLSEGV
jgi:hypothetical protein